MAVYTSINQQQLSAFLTGYQCGELQSFDGIQAGVENSNFHVYTSEGHYILTIFEKRVKMEDLPFFFAFTEHAARHGVTCPRGVADREGDTVGRIADKPAALITFLEGEQISSAQVTEAHCRELGQAVARLHRASGDFKGYRPNALSLKGWKELAEKTKARADEVEKGLAAFIGKELAYLERMWPESLPAGVIHADIFPDNVFFKNDKWAGFIDFYFSCTDFLAYDLAIVVNAWCFDGNGTWNARKCEALMQGYDAGRGLTDGEKQSFAVLCRGAAMRILLTRLHDWLFHDPANFVVPKDPKEYLDKLRFHQGERVHG